MPICCKYRFVLDEAGEVERQQKKHERSHQTCGLVSWVIIFRSNKSARIWCSTKNTLDEDVFQSKREVAKRIILSESAFLHEERTLSPPNSS